MNWVKKHNPHKQNHGVQSGTGKAISPPGEDDTLGDYVRPSSHQIEVQELTEEEFEALLASQRPA